MVPDKEVTFEVRVYEIEKGQSSRYYRRLTGLFQTETDEFFATFDKPPEFIGTIGIDPGETKSVSNKDDLNNLSRVATTLEISTGKQKSGALDSEFTLTRKEINKPIGESAQADDKPSHGFGSFNIGGGIPPRGAIISVKPGDENLNLNMPRESRVKVRRSGNFLVMIRAVYPELEAKLSRRSDLIPSLYFNTPKNQE